MIHLKPMFIHWVSFLLFVFISNFISYVEKGITILEMVGIKGKIRT